MKENKRFTAFKISVSIFGAVALAFSLVRQDWAALFPSIVVLLAFSALIAPRMNISLPHSQVVLSFSDSATFFSFLMFGPHAAVWIAAIEMFFSCLYLRRKGTLFSRWSIGFNIGATTISTFVSVSVLTLLGRETAMAPGVERYTLANVGLLLGVLAILQFLVGSFFISVYQSLKFSSPWWEIWKGDYLSSSLTNFAGAGLAGIAYSLFSAGDAGASIVGIVIFVVFFLTYRQIMAKMSESIEKISEVGAEKAEVERRRREEVEAYATQLAVSLKEKEATVAELTESRRAFRHAAMHDALTSLPNRVYFCEFLDQLIAETRSQDGDRQGTHYVLFMDLSRFKSVNDTLGHNFGDRVLEAAAQRLRLSVAESDVVARFGGDEFAVVIKNVRSVADAERIAWRIHDRIAEPVSIDGSRITVGTKIGVAPLTADYSSPEEVLRDADIAMHHAEERGTNVEFFNQEIRDASLFRSQIESELPFAIERDELHLHYQPMISLSDGSLMGLEALARWNHPTKGPISPAEFVPVAEDSGLIVQMTSWLLREACRDLAAWQKSAPENAALVVSVNISGRHLSHQSLVNDIRKSLREHRLDPRTLKLEITESVAMENSGRSIEALTELARLGVQLSIDDFGTGYSNLGYLHKLPFDTIKIDRSFVASIGERGGEPGMLQTIMSLAKNLKMKVIAEGIETSEQLEMLQSLGCDYGQGYLISRPVAPTAIDELMRAKKFWLPEAGFGAVASHGDAEKLQRIN